MTYSTRDDRGDSRRVHAKTPWRSQMNVAFTLSNEQVDRILIEVAREYAIVGLDGDRSPDGTRASLYNAVTPEGGDSLCEALTEFCRQRAGDQP
jgi:phosphoserine aminotransferase